jgi:hypothetical protein
MRPVGGHILRDAAKTPLLRMRFESGDGKIENGDRHPSW